MERKPAMKLHKACQGHELFGRVLCAALQLAKRNHPSPWTTTSSPTMAQKQRRSMWMMRIRRQRRTTGTPQIFEEEQEPEVWEVFCRSECRIWQSALTSQLTGGSCGAEYGAAGFVPVHARVCVQRILISTDLAMWYTLLP